MILLTAQDISKSYMERAVLDHISFFLGEGDKVGIIGINGTGKSTLLRILAGAEEPDSGQMIRTNGIRVSYLPQIPAFEDSGSVLSQVLAHLPKDLADSREYEAKATLARLGIPDYDRDIASLSGGERRRAGIAAALIAPSDVLLLDEPTNHIDHETAQMLEDLLLRYRGAIVMVTHDRYFLDKICNRIVEVDKGHLYPCDGNYSAYVTQKHSVKRMHRLRNERHARCTGRSLHGSAEAPEHAARNPETASSALRRSVTGRSLRKQNGCSSSPFPHALERRP